MSHGVQGRRRATPLDPELAAAVAETMQALAAPSRLLIIDRLRRGPASVSALAEAVAMEQSAVSHQLRILRHLRMVVGVRQGKRVIYSLHDSHLGTLLEEAVGHTEHLRLRGASAMPEVLAS